MRRRSGSPTRSPIWHGRVEIDRFNELVLRARLTWQQVDPAAPTRSTCAKPHSPTARPTSRTCSTAIRSPRGRWSSCSRRCSPRGRSRTQGRSVGGGTGGGRHRRVDEPGHRPRAARVRVDDQATLRTNYFVSREDSARAQNVLAVKLNLQLIDELPLPRPMFEIFVYSPRVEGVHLRFGFVARGGLRWSDRKEDFRTEILGLVKAQAVKNAVIVPVGAKGGFVVKQPSPLTGDAAADRETQRNDGIACYKLFISGLLDITDNVDQITGKVVTLADVAPRRRRRLSGGGRRQRDGDVLRYRERRGEVLRLLARRRIRLRWVGRLRPQGDGHHRQGRVGKRQAALPRDGRRHPVRGLHRRRHRRHEW